MTVTEVLWEAMSSQEPVYGLTSGRLLPTAAALLAAGALGVSLAAVSRARRPGSSPRLAAGATVFGAATTVMGSILWATAGGGPGTGNGMVAAWIATGLGLVACALGGTAWRLGRRPAQGDPTTP
ncbi:DUF6223 family protein [Isoptericola sp. NEAU-Y5]|uniref:DUF6223 family protein n=1 Tax=Isoptericola luteus TaxID=2879484 RepID=A0ABS7ZAL3_9MICO|nr:DUF6223 family protein [Isoptericola sp. NEAU-Y5]MCA5891928.1 DUF6223 family protein [Isoptericola sp. NEAU-Y5]